MKLNIAHITLSMGTGGLENLIVSLVSQTDREKYAVTVGCLDYGGDLLKHIHDSGHDCFVTGRRPGFDGALILKLAKLFSQKKVHIVHTHNQAAHFYAGIASRLARVPVLITTEHSRHNTDLFLRRKIEKLFLYAITDQWVVVSDELAQQAVCQDRLPAKKLIVVNNGVDFGKFQIPNMGKDSRLHFKRELNLPDDSFVIIMVARLHPIKNHALMLHAFSLIADKIPHVRLLLVGDGECRHELKNLASQLQIGRNIRFLGIREDIPDLLNASDLFVLCSKSEGLPLSLLEACAANVPVLITEQANRACFIRDKENGTVVAGDVESIANGISKIINNYSACRDMSRAAREKVESKYSLRSMEEKYNNIYLTAIKKNEH